MRAPARPPAPAKGEALLRHRAAGGKIQMLPKCAVRGAEDFAVWYTPGVAEACRAIVENADAADECTNRANLVAVVSDGTRVLGLGDIGPAAGLPVMEGKALLFKYLGGVDAVPICLDTKEPDEIVKAVQWLAPSFGAINLEDIAQPKCFRVLAALRATLRIPVWHDDQQGTATVVLAGLTNALRITGRRPETARIALIGVGAANVAVYRLLVQRGADPRNIVACDSVGTLHPDRGDIERLQETFPEKWRICRETNAAGRTGKIADALQGADVCLAFSTPGPGIIQPPWIAAMAKDAIVFACANPVPEIWPDEALRAGARVVATGRSDFANQVNNSLAFPGVFRGALDVRARALTEGMALAAADALAAHAVELGLRDDRILPPMDDTEAVVRIAAAVGMQAQAERLARLPRPEAELRALARAAIARSRRSTEALAEAGLLG